MDTKSKDDQPEIAQFDFWTELLIDGSEPEKEMAVRYLDAWFVLDQAKNYHFGDRKHEEQKQEAS